MVINLVIFIILGLVIFLVSKYLKNKPLKITIMSFVVLLMCYTLILTVDMSRTTSMKEPIFAKTTETEKENKMVVYKGLGYRIEIEYGYGQIPKDKPNQIISCTMYFFNKVVAGVIS